LWGVKIGKFEPLIIGFVCNECVYAAADLAGTSRFSYPENVRLIRVPCSGQVDIIHILRAFENGTDGVFVGGCLKDQCHYVDGNYKAEARMEFLKGILNALGLEEQRLGIYFLSAAMAREFVNIAWEFTESVSKLGPSPLRKSKPRSLAGENKRENLREMMLSISETLKAKDPDLHIETWGFGYPQIDEEKCIGCGACAFVCKDKAMTAETKNDIIQINNTYWRCTACGKCQDFCPKECVEVTQEFDLTKFLMGDEEKKVKVGMMECESCGKRFLPVMLASEIENILTDKSFASSYVSTCPDCRKVICAERVRAATGLYHDHGDELGKHKFSWTKNNRIKIE
jgi:coenzyme F420-reducing hydrogenase delta subunit/formate hydrogenlyase subunit 6/NADH:ubiquinone oxidoreductase subunit I